MTEIVVRFQCGCERPVDVDKVTSPVCPEHGQRARGVVKAPMPRFTGYCAGPSATAKALEPVAVTVATRPLPDLVDPLADEGAA